MMATARGCNSMERWTASVIVRDVHELASACTKGDSASEGVWAADSIDAFFCYPRWLDSVKCMQGMTCRDAMVT